MDSSLKKEIINKWSRELSSERQVVVLFEKVRDIPYGEIGSRDSKDVYNANQGTCSGKHELLKELFKELGIPTQDFIAMHRFKDMQVDYPAEIKEVLERSDIIDPHNFFKAFLDNKWVIVDATWDLPLKSFGFVVNENWDGKSDMKICVSPFEIIETNNPLKIKEERLSQLKPSVQEDRKIFLKKLTEWLETVRK